MEESERQVTSPALSYKERRKERARQRHRNRPNKAYGVLSWEEQQRKDEVDDAREANAAAEHAKTQLKKRKNKYTPGEKPPTPKNTTSFVIDHVDPRAKKRLTRQSQDGYQLDDFGTFVGVNLDQMKAVVSEERLKQKSDAEIISELRARVADLENENHDVREKLMRYQR